MLATSEEGIVSIGNIPEYPWASIFRFRGRQRIRSRGYLRKNSANSSYYVEPSFILVSPESYWFAILGNRLNSTEWGFLPVGRTYDHRHDNSLAPLMLLYSTLHLSFITVVRIYEISANEQENYLRSLQPVIDNPLPFLTRNDLAIVPLFD